MHPAMSLAVDAHNYLGEGVLWCERSAHVFWTDIGAQKLHAMHPASGVAREWLMPERLCCFSFTADADVLLLGLASRLALFNLQTLALSEICTVEADLATTRVNDGRCDRQGRFVFGTLDEALERQAIGSFYRLNGDLTLERLPLPGVAISNSICFSVDGSAMYFCDSMERIIYRWDGYALDNSADIRVFADLNGDPGADGGAPDGATIDADGFLWSAQWGSARVTRYAPDGAIDCIVSLPVTQPSCVCLGGAQLDHLFVTTAQESLSNAQLARQPQAGGLFHAQMAGVRGLPEARFNLRINSL